MGDADLPAVVDADRYTKLPEHTREFLEDLREEEIDDLRETIEFYRSVKTVGRFMKWLIILMVGAFIGSIALAENVAKVITWFKGAPRP